MKEHLAAAFIVLVIVISGMFAYAQLGTSRDINYAGSQDAKITQTDEKMSWKQIRYDGVAYRVIRNIVLNYEKESCEDKMMVIDAYVRAHEARRPK
jgi:hypothetical protein